MGVLGPISPISVTTPSALPPLPQISYSDALQLPNLTLPGISGSSGVNQTGNVSQATALSTPTQPGGATPTSSASVLQQAAALFNALGPGVAKGASAQASAGVSTLFGLSIGRIAAFALGLILIAGGIFLFGRQPITQVVATAARAAVAV